MERVIAKKRPTLVKVILLLLATIYFSVSFFKDFEFNFQVQTIISLVILLIIVGSLIFQIIVVLKTPKKLIEYKKDTFIIYLEKNYHITIYLKDVRSITIGEEKSTVVINTRDQGYHIKNVANRDKVLDELLDIFKKYEKRQIFEN